MAYTNSPLISATILSPNYGSRIVDSNPNGVIDTITIHHMAGNLSIELCGQVFSRPSQQASSNYGIGSDGRIGMYVEERNRSWCSSSRKNDSRAVTIEVANNINRDPWTVSDAAIQSLIRLCEDICRRNNIKRINYTGDTSGNLTKHQWFAATGCPGDYLGGKFAEIADAVNKLLGQAYTPSIQPEAAKHSIDVGDVVKVKPGSYYFGTRTPIANWVCNEEWIVHSIAGSRVVIDSSVNGNYSIMSPVAASDLILVKDHDAEDNSNSDLEVTDMDMRTIGMGDTGSQVAALQAMLIGYGYSVGRAGADGIFGSGTHDAVKSYQSRHGLSADGICGRNTWNALINGENKGSAPKTITIGSTVRINAGATDYNGGGLANFLYKRNHKVSSLSGDRAVLSYDGVVVAAVKVANLTLV